MFIIYDRERKGTKEILMAIFTEADARAGQTVSADVRLRQLVNRAVETSPP